MIGNILFTLLMWAIFAGYAFGLHDALGKGNAYAARSRKRFERKESPFSFWVIVAVESLFAVISFLMAIVLTAGILGIAI